MGEAVSLSELRESTEVAQSPAPQRTDPGLYLKENGWLLFVLKAGEIAYRWSRDRALAHQLRTVGMRLGRAPKLRGLRHLHIGDRFSAGDMLWLEAITRFEGASYQPSLTIGEDVNFSDNVHVGCIHRVVIGNGVLCGSKVVITDHNHGCYNGAGQTGPEERPGLRRLFSEGAVLIGDHVWLGDGVAVLAGANIGAGTIVGANSVVNGTLPDFCVAVGAPARPVKQWDPQARQWIKI